MSHVSSPPRRIQKVAKGALPYVAIGVVFILGLIGFHKLFGEVAPQEAGKAQLWVNALYVTFGLFTLRSGFLGPSFLSAQIPWELEVARWLAVALAGVAVWKAAVQIFHRQLAARRLRRLAGHTVVCGLGRKGFELVRALSCTRAVVVAVERDPGNANISRCDELGVPVLTGDARDESVLARVGINKANRVIFTCDNDVTTVQAVVRAREIALRQNFSNKWPVSYYAEIREAPFAALLYQHPSFTQPANEIPLTVFNADENTARRLFATYPLEVPTRHKTGRPPRETIHLVLVGFGALGQNVAIQAARIGHFAMPQKLRITVIDPRAEQRRWEFVAKYPRVESVCEIAFDPRAVEQEEMRRDLQAWTSDQSELTKIVVCQDDDEQSLMTLLCLAPAIRDLKEPVYLQQRSEYGFAQMVSLSHLTSMQPWLIPFGMPEEAVDLEDILHDRLDRVARTIHEEYVELRRAVGATFESDPALVPWPSLAETLRSSNRQQADHVDVKLRAIGCRRVAVGKNDSSSAAVSFTDDEVEVMASMEHARWCAERLLDGWQYGDHKDKARKISSDLVDWAVLAEGSRDRDRYSVRQIPKILATVGERIERSKAPSEQQTGC